MQPVLFETYPTQDGNCVLEIKLNSPKTLNALTLEMVTLIKQRLDQVKDNPKVVAVLLDSVLDKAFCAGGDVVGIIQAANQGDLKLAEDFFTAEYALDLSIHQYPKPIICIANGIVLGGGMGLMNGCSHRVVTETTYLAMPEVSIGLFPDVGGGWFLNQLPPGYGLFLGLTAAPLNAADTLYLELADLMISSEYRSQIIDKLTSAVWQGNPHAVVDKALESLQKQSNEQLETIEPNLQKHKELIEGLAEIGSLAAVVAKIQNHASDDKWIHKVQSNVAYGSPFSMRLIEQQLEKAKGMTLEQVFEFEYHLAIESCKYGEFAEGVRALLIDKDRQPNWKFSTIDKVDSAHITSFTEKSSVLSNQA